MLKGWRRLRYLYGIDWVSCLQASVRHRGGKVGMSITDSLGQLELGQALSKRLGLASKILLTTQITLGES